MEADWETYAEVSGVRSHVGAHFLPVDYIAAVSCVPAHGSCACSFVEAFVDHFGCKF